MFHLVSSQAKGLTPTASVLTAPVLLPSRCAIFAQDIHLLHRVRTVDELIISCGQLGRKDEGLFPRLVSMYQRHFQALDFFTIKQEKEYLKQHLCALYQIFVHLYRQYTQCTYVDSHHINNAQVHQCFGRYLTLFPWYERDFLSLAHKLQNFIQTLSDAPEEMPQLLQSLDCNQDPEVVNPLYQDDVEDMSVYNFFSPEHLFESTALSLLPFSIDPKRIWSCTDQLLKGVESLSNAALESQKLSSKERSVRSLFSENTLAALLLEQLCYSQYSLESDDFLLTLFWLFHHGHCKATWSPQEKNFSTVKELQALLRFFHQVDDRDSMDPNLSLRQWLRGSGVWHKRRLKYLNGAVDLNELRGFSVGQCSVVKINSGLEVWYARAVNEEKNKSHLLVSSPENLLLLYDAVLAELTLDDCHEGEVFQLNSIARFGHFYITQDIEFLKGDEVDKIAKFIQRALSDTSLPRLANKKLWGTCSGRQGLCCIVPPGYVKAETIEVESYCYYLVNQDEALYSQVLAQCIYSDQLLKQEILAAIKNEARFEKNALSYAVSTQLLMSETYYSLKAAQSRVEIEHKEALVIWYADTFRGIYLPTALDVLTLFEASRVI